MEKCETGLQVDLIHVHSVQQVVERIHRIQDKRSCHVPEKKIKRKTYICASIIIVALCFPAYKETHTFGFHVLFYFDVVI